MATQRFLNLPEEKRHRVEQAAVAEFARHGFEHANTNRIAHAAGISVGALFKYFPTKDSLFRHIVSLGASTIEAQVRALEEAQGPVVDRLAALLRLVVESSREHPAFVQLYHELTATGTRELAHAVAMELEGFTSRTYTSWMASAQAAGEVRSDLEPGLLAFLIDNVLMTLQYSLTCDYYVDRLALYSPGADDDTIVAQTLAFLTAAIGAHA